MPPAEREPPIAAMRAQGHEGTDQFTVVVMAGSRGGIDPVAAAAGTSHKCLADVAGVTMLERVLQSLEGSRQVGRIVLCMEDSTAASSIVGARRAAGTLQFLASAASPALSALKALDELAGALPLLIVTADHALLTPAMVDHFCARARACGDIAVGVVPAGLVTGAYPQTIRTLLKFADDAYCGCNLFALNTAAARRGVAFLATVEAARKRPWVMIRALGITALLLYLCRRLTLAGAMRRISARLGLQVTALSMPFAEAAIDVDKPADLALAEHIMRAREGGMPG